MFTQGHTTLTEIFKEAVKDCHGDFSQAIFSATPTRMARTFLTGYGDEPISEDFDEATCWCGDRVYITSVVEGKLRVVSTLRNPPQEG
jgi:hypothetical protein